VHHADLLAGALAVLTVALALTVCLASMDPCSDRRSADNEAVFFEQIRDQGGRVTWRTTGNR
jgi:hypothetical protein